MVQGHLVSLFLTAHRFANLNLCHPTLSNVVQRISLFCQYQEKFSEMLLLLIHYVSLLRDELVLSNSSDNAKHANDNDISVIILLIIYVL